MAVAISGMERECILCGSPASRRESDAQPRVLLWECAQCGVWRVGLAREIALERMNADARRTLAMQVRDRQAHSINSVML